MATKREIDQAIKHMEVTLDKKKQIIYNIETAMRNERKKLKEQYEKLAYYKDKAKRRKCVLCGKRFIGFGHNAEPKKKGKCCDYCNVTKVLPKRMEMTA